MRFIGLRQSDSVLNDSAARCANKIMDDIIWPEAYLPGMTDNYVSNELIVSGLGTVAVWAAFNDTSLWPSYYSNVSDIDFHNSPGPQLHLSARFRFTTFNFPVEAHVTEYQPPVNDEAARVAWHGWVDDGTIMLGCLKICRAGGYAYWPKKPQLATPRRPSLRSSPIQCLKPIKNGLKAWRR